MRLPVITTEQEFDEFARSGMWRTPARQICRRRDLSRYALKLKPEAVNFSFDELEKAIWNFAE